jgi:SAM-dependent methyltransferase
MGFHNDFILPRLIDLAMRNKELMPFRERVIGAGEGRVLEIGVGSGSNLPFYRSPVREVLALEPAPRLVKMARNTSRASSIPVSFLEASAEAIPLDGHSIDTVVTTWTLCAIPQAAAALAGYCGRAASCCLPNTGRAPDEGVRWWQDRLTPIWRRCGGGFHLNRQIRSMIEGAGFRIDRIETGYIPGPKPMTFMYEGSARPQ